MESDKAQYIPLPNPADDSKVTHSHDEMGASDEAETQEDEAESSSSDHEREIASNRNVAFVANPKPLPVPPSKTKRVGLFVRELSDTKNKKLTFDLFFKMQKVERKLGIAIIGAEDSFFDSCAEALRERNKHSSPTAQKLKNEYNTTDHESDDLKARVLWLISKYSELKELKLRVHLFEVSSDPEGSRVPIYTNRIIPENDSEDLKADQNIDWADRNILHLAVCDGRVVPILKTTTRQEVDIAPLELEQRATQSPKAGARDIDSSEGVSDSENHEIEVLPLLSPVSSKSEGKQDLDQPQEPPSVPLITAVAAPVPVQAIRTGTAVPTPEEIAVIRRRKRNDEKAPVKKRQQAPAPQLMQVVVEPLLVVHANEETPLLPAEQPQVIQMEPVVVAKAKEFPSSFPGVHRGILYVACLFDALTHKNEKFTCSTKGKYTPDVIRLQTLIKQWIKDATQGLKVLEHYPQLASRLLNREHEEAIHYGANAAGGKAEFYLQQYREALALVIQAFEKVKKVKHISIPADNADPLSAEVLSYAKFLDAKEFLEQARVLSEFYRREGLMAEDDKITKAVAPSNKKVNDKSGLQGGSTFECRLLEKHADTGFFCVTQESVGLTIHSGRSRRFEFFRAVYNGGTSAVTVASLFYFVAYVLAISANYEVGYGVTIGLSVPALAVMFLALRYRTQNAWQKRYVGNNVVGNHEVHCAYDIPFYSLEDFFKGVLQKPITEDVNEMLAQVGALNLHDMPHAQELIERAASAQNNLSIADLLAPLNTNDQQAMDRAGSAAHRAAAHPGLSNLEKMDQLWFLEQLRLIVKIKAEEAMAKLLSAHADEEIFENPLNAVARRLAEAVQKMVGVEATLTREVAAAPPTREFFQVVGNDAQIYLSTTEEPSDQERREFVDTINKKLKGLSEDLNTLPQPLDADSQRLIDEINELLRAQGAFLGRINSMWAQPGKIDFDAVMQKAEALDDHVIQRRVLFQGGNEYMGYQSIGLNASYGAIN